MCIRSLRLGFVSRFTLRMRSLRCWEERRTLSISGRLFCGWLDLVSHTMPQEMAVCSTILCIYLAGAPAPVTEQLEAPEGSYHGGALLLGVFDEARTNGARLPEA